ncbi:MAG: hypothetical protein E2O39_05790 [Planctomycetota bacterium]|nr:MAG: hypothetical protein E2O39_05790 [Planctomycetota bacterium]
MAVEVESSGQIEEFLGVLKRRMWMIVLPAALSTAIGVCFSVLVPKKYVVETHVIVRNTLAGADGRAVGGGNSAREAQVAKQDIRAYKRIRGVLTKLKWPEFLPLSRDEQNDYLRKILEGVSVTLVPVPKDAGAQPVIIKFTHTDALRAKEFLEELSKRWQEEVLTRGRNAEQKAVDGLNERRGALETELEDIRDRLTELRTTYSIAPVVQQNTGKNQGPATDPLFEQIPREAVELDTLKGDIAQLETDIAAAVKRWSRMDEERAVVEETPGLEFAMQIQEHRLAVRELRQTIENKGYKQASLKRQALEQKIRNLEREIQVLEDNQTQTGSTERWVPNEAKFLLEEQIAQDKIELERLVASQVKLDKQLKEHKERAVELTEVYSRIAALESQRDDIATGLTEIRYSYELAERRLSWLLGPGGDPFEVQQPVELPTVPTEPNPVFIIAFSVFIGLALGFGLAMVLEYSKNCFRSVYDISRVMMVPVLGTINAIRTRSERRRSLLGRLLLVGSTLTIIGLMGYVTWAWRFNTHMLSDRMRDAIEDFRDYFK